VTAAYCKAHATEIAMGMSIAEQILRHEEALAEAKRTFVHSGFRATNVWITRHGRWQIVGAHNAFVIDPKPRVEDGVR